MSTMYVGKSEALPAIMRGLHQWVNWRYEVQKKGEKPTKPPLNPHTIGARPARKNRHASTTNPQTWSTFEHVCRNMSDSTGIGFVFTPPYIGLDLDHCVIDGVLNFHAREVLAKFSHTYAEISPSGTGIHFIVQGVFLWEKGIKGNVIEIYSPGRYFTVTGNTLEKAPPQIQHVSEEELRWLETKSSSKVASKSTNGTDEPAYKFTKEPHADNTALGKGTTLYDMLCANNLNWEPTWDCSRKLEGLKGDQSSSAREMSLARMAFQADVEDQDIYNLLVGWRIDQHLPPKHHGALVLTIENAHKAYTETRQEKQLDTPESLPSPDRLSIVRKYVGLSVIRLVQMGRGGAHYRAHLATGEVLDFGNYTGFSNAQKWEQYAWEYAGKEIFTEKKHWAKLCRLLRACLEVEESEEVGVAADTRAWLSEYLGDMTRHPATVDTLKYLSPFVDETGQHIQLDAFRGFVLTKFRANITRSAMAGRLRVLGWAEIKLTRTDETGTGGIVRNYWYSPLSDVSASL